MNGNHVEPFTESFDPDEVENLATLSAPIPTWSPYDQYSSIVYDGWGRELAKFTKMDKGIELDWVNSRMSPAFLKISHNRDHTWTSPEELVVTMRDYIRQPRPFEESALYLVGNLLFEGRVDAAMRKYPSVDKKVWEIFVQNDPSGGRHKYIDWLGKSGLRPPRKTDQTPAT